MRNQQRSQQQKHPDQELFQSPTPFPDAAKKADSHLVGIATYREETYVSREEEEDSLAAVKDEYTAGVLPLIENGGRSRHQNQNGQVQQHPPDCLCILRKQTRGKNFFLPPPYLTSVMEKSDDFYCLGVSSEDCSNRAK
jgi:hypothetical protein